MDLKAKVERIRSGGAVWVTGAAGFLGAEFCRVLKEGGCTVLPVDPACEPFMKAQDLHRRTVPTPSWILHCAGIASPQNYRARPLETIEAAVDGTRAVLEVARQVDNVKALYFSSSEIYGDPDAWNIPTREDYRGNVSCLGNRACYDESKRLGETLCRVYAKHFGVHVVIVRPFNFYGPTMRDDDYRMMPNLRRALRDGKPMRIYGNGNQTRTFCYVDDGIEGCLAALLRGRPGEPYNIGCSQPEISMLELARMVGVGATCMPHPPEYPADEPHRRCPDVSKARDELGWAATTTLDEGLRRFLEC